MSDDSDLLSTLYADLFGGLPQQGPGSDASTLRALALVRPPPQPAIADLGAGTGRSTCVLLEHTDGLVVAVDLLPAFLRVLERRVGAAGFAARVRTLECSIDRLPFAAASLDLIWSEGAAYTIGFDRALGLWRPLLRPGGALAVTELCWLVDDPPEEARRFMGEAYPPMRSHEANAAALEHAGYRLAGSFVLPESDWWQGYYLELEGQARSLRARYAAAPGALAELDGTLREIDLFRQCGYSYGYVFYVATTP